MEKSSSKGTGIAVLIILYLLAAILVAEVPTFLEKYRIMTGEEGLRNIMFCIGMRGLSALMQIFPIFIVGFISIIGKHSDNQESSSAAARFIKALPLFILFPVMILCLLSRSHFVEQSKIKEYMVFGDLRLFMDCAADLTDDSFDEFIVSHGQVDTFSYVSMVGRGNSSHHDEYVVRCSKGDFEELFAAQIGFYDCDDLKYMVSDGDEIKVKVYSHSGFVKTWEKISDPDYPMEVLE